MRRLILAAMLLTLANCVWAFSGNDLLRNCQEGLSSFDAAKNDNAQQAAVCAYFVDGILEGVQSAEAILGEGKKPYRIICKPTGTTYGQLARAVAKWLEDNPERLHENAAMLVVLALSETFPCKE